MRSINLPSGWPAVTAGRGLLLGICWLRAISLGGLPDQYLPLTCEYRGCAGTMAAVGHWVYSGVRDLGDALCSPLLPRLDTVDTKEDDEHNAE